MSSPPKAPPRFVPTLTDVVQLSDGVPGVGQPGPAMPGSPPPAAPAVSPSFSKPPVVAGLPPRPVLSPVVAPSMARSVVPPAAPVAPRAPVPSPMDFGRSAEGLKDIEEVVIHRVMQRVDVVLDQRLREAIATVVLEQTRSIVPRLREEVESVVRHAVYEAVAEELAGHAGTPPV
ncbi:hypothetical protein AVKW3434_17690 [Acidovorax sp. SUPP3434]|uniref:hypothetical protein n=1 Tax=Acidovorax sp. SUPP3434 TaxID=2920880 RepID=UPI0023DE5433|nr:hypothetical protein [Acidovorax sp. SUPP3434]GKT01249.1 hypothetical protein AVKW3434_17690 [Acidovorax sp. SUPP3434]